MKIISLQYRHFLMIFISIIIIVGAFYYGFHSISINRIIKEINSAKTPEDERVAFLKLLHISRGKYGILPVQRGFQAFDRQGQIVDRSHENWWNSVVTLRISVNDKRLNHKVIDPENIDILMRD